MRETLAAAALMAIGWNGTTPLLDPMCGSGTIPIEGALIARRIAPGLRRHFAFESWPSFSAAEWRDVVGKAQSDVLAASPVLIQGSDRDAGAIESARANAERAGVVDDIELTARPLSAIEPREGPGSVVLHPPYGVRVGESNALRNLYAQLGKVLAAKCRGWTVGIVSADQALERQTRLQLHPVLRTSNGGIRIRVVAGEVSMGRGVSPRGVAPTGTADAQRYSS
jgi:putative N6-adenine-specific DNA methylase